MELAGSDIELEPQVELGLRLRQLLVLDTRRVEALEVVDRWNGLSKNWQLCCSSAVAVIYDQCKSSANNFKLTHH